MTHRSPVRRLLAAGHAVCTALGLTLCAIYAVARSDASVSSARDVEDFLDGLRDPDQTLWSAKRVSDYRAALQLRSEPPVALLRIPAITLEAPVYASATELSLNRGVALIEGMAQPDAGGNLGIAGHRDGYFRVLRQLKPNDLIEVRTRRKLHRYRVTGVAIVDAGDTHLLVDTDEPSVTLVTCYPFYFIGSAPQRFIVRATYEWNARS